MSETQSEDEIVDNVTKSELFKLIRESVKSQTINAEATNGINALLTKMEQRTCEFNDQLVFHRNSTEENIKLIKEDLIKYVKLCLVIIFTLLGGIVITRILGLDIIKLINEIGL
jgi:hypothetical protein